MEDFLFLVSYPIFMLNNTLIMEQKENDLFSFANYIRSHCGSRKVVKYGICIMKLENGTVLRVQRYIYRIAGYSIIARPSNYGYGKDYPDEVR